ncbi:type III-B CRISPR-associated protein Cas10/Cmr2 [Paenibacillus sp. IB182496]|uniref:Type III-B CRISPR-associated protein Cas10/Cmr2 n=1 Tax=Paenibacillus sabuli TaxID=2772509 RepID=A0A927BN73_9BACL|nr:type III-B CRISPR-associated protein Cas10/Cmr2 [Paenibacillus sabuli]MBD2843611.1 type III-B CRISPR-associated protein Cas10/Cmr2 [Paenibacillus sabuli]
MPETKAYYCVFAIGPVQSFIAASRKLEDLWGGSYLLSFLVQSTLKTLTPICRNHGVQKELLYPALEERSKADSSRLAIANFPNRLTFTLIGNEEPVQNVMQALQHHALGELIRISNWVVDEVFDTGSPSAKDRTGRLKLQAEEQVKQFLEVNWIAHRISSKEDWDGERQEAERLFQAIKVQRPIKSFPEKGIACTVYQRMDALCDKDPLPTDRYGQLKSKLMDTWGNRHYTYKPSDPQNPDKARIRDNEFLCAISLIRRVARDFFMHEYEVGSDVFSRYESVVDLGAEEDGYYAVLLMDGDNMGQFFSGSQEIVRSTSQKLSYFATNQVPDIVSGNKGVLLYAGGDDVLAIFPVNNVLPAAYQLRMAFSDDAVGLLGATASAGIAIGHKRTPLQQMLTEARSLEQAAKHYAADGANGMNKNAFALSVLPRSGEYLGSIVLPWTKNEVSVTGQLSEMAELLGAVVSTAFIYQLASTFQGLIGSAPDQEPEHLEEMVRLECCRLIDRAVYDVTLKKELQITVSRLPELYRQVGLKKFIDLLKMTAFFSRKEMKA